MTFQSPLNQAVDVWLSSRALKDFACNAKLSVIKAKQINNKPNTHETQYLNH